MTTRTLFCIAAALGMLVAQAGAAPYWIAWEGNDFPENEGWERIVNGPQLAERTLADGIMTMDGLADRQIDDYYRMERSIDPEPGEMFVMQWRIRVAEIIGHPLGLYDPGLGLFSDDDWALAFVLGTDFIRSFHEDVNLPFESGVFHVFEVRSRDMRTYELRMDQVLVHAGTFWEPTFTSSRIQWGDYTRGSASLVDWDYFRFGVVPEPASIWLVLVGLGAAVALRARRAPGRLVFLSLLLCALSAPATATPYWVAWDGNDFPENEGWERYHYGPNGPPADRSLADGVMTLDGLASIEIVDGYRMDRSLNPDPGEQFVVQWGLRVNDVPSYYPYDPGLAIYSDDGWHFLLVIGVDEVHSILEQENADFEAGLFHAWEFRSANMRSYTLLVDGTVILTGDFTQSGAITSRVDWGDVVFGANSHTDWDYLRFGVVPEPGAFNSLLAILCVARALRRERTIQ